MKSQLNQTKGVFTNE